MNSGHNYEGKGHFSCSGKHPNELVATYLTRLSKPLKETFHIPLTAQLASPGEQDAFCFALRVRGDDCAPREKLPQRLRAEQTVIHHKNNNVSKVMP